MGIVGTDVLDELDDGVRKSFCEQVIGPICNSRGQPLRKVLLVQEQRKSEIEERLGSGDVLRIGTSYPLAAKRTLGNAATILVVCAGGAEALPAMYPELDAIYEAYQTGDSAVVNGLAPIDMALLEARFPAFSVVDTLRVITNVNE